MTKTRLAASLLAVCFGAVAVACSRSTTPTIPIATYTVAVAPQSVTLRSVGDSAHLVAAVSPTIVTAQFIWTSSDASRVSINAAGWAHAVALPLAGISLCAALSTDQSVFGCATVITPGQ